MCLAFRGRVHNVGGYQSVDTKTEGNRFNALYASLLFLQDWEYTGNVTLAREFTYPLVSSLTEFFHCMLTRDSDDGLLHDYHDSGFEGGGDHSNDPTATNALLRRMITFQLALASDLKLKPPPWLRGMLTDLVPLPIVVSPALAGQEVWAGGGAPWKFSTRACSGSGSCDPFFPVFPSELINPRTANDRVKRIANATAWTYTHNMSRPELLNFSDSHVHVLDLAVFWPFVIRSSTNETAEAVVRAFIVDSASRIGPNLVKYATGGGTENAGLAQAINDMLLSSDIGGAIQLFPCWPAKHPARFVQLRAKGGHLVSARWDNVTRTVADVVVASTSLAADGRSRTIRLLNPWNGAPARVDCGRSSAMLMASGSQWLEWRAQVGVDCHVERAG